MLHAKHAWTYEQHMQLIRLYRARKTTTEIARALGLRSRNQVCGKLWRLRQLPEFRNLLTPRGSPIIKKEASK